MKNLLIVTLLLSIFIAPATAQKCKAKNVPPAVMMTFSKSYPKMKKACWGKDNSNYQVTFHNGKGPVAITYDPMGTRIITEMQMPVEDLPQPTMGYVLKNYPGEIFRDVAQITNAAGIVTYEIEVKDVSLIFDAKGDFIESMKL